ncbi:MAG: nuclear transport factor 2 family protein, partial [Sphingobacterium thalpophilum]
MKNITYIFVLFMLTAFVANAQSKTEQAVATAIIALHSNVVNPDRKALEMLVSNDLSYGHSAGKVENKDQFIDFLFNGPFKFTAINTSDQTIRVSGKDAIVRHVFLGKATNAGVPTEIKVGNLMIWRKEGGSWRLLARQA